MGGNKSGTAKTATVKTSDKNTDTKANTKPVPVETKKPGKEMIRLQIKSFKQKYF